MATPAQFYDQNGELRLDGTLVGGGGSSANAVTLLGPFAVLESDVELTLWTPAVGDVLLDIWTVLLTSFSGSGQKIEVYTGNTDLFNAGSVNALTVSGSTQDATRRWPLEDWRASSYPSTGTQSVPTTFRTTDPVLADVIGHGVGAGVAHIYAYVATPA